MADPYSGVSITGYNSNPPADDGSQTEANRVKWATIKTKLNDPVKTRTDDINTALIAAFAKVIGGAGITSTSIGYTVLSTDQGKLVRATNGGITITTPDATDVDAPFVFCLLNDSATDITLEGSGSQTIDGDTTVTVPPNAGLTVFTDGTNWFTSGQNFQRTLVKPQGYLTVMSVAASPNGPLPTSDQNGVSSVYYRPDAGNLIPIPDGTTFAVREFTELTLSLNNPNHVAATIYDVFIFSDSGTIRIGTGPAWTTSTAGAGARGSGAASTELAILKGLFVNNVQITARNGSTTYTVAAKSGIYVGSLVMDGSAGQVTCTPGYGQNRKWGVWNAYNRRPIFIKAGDATSTWVSNNGSGVHPANASTNNNITVFSGLPDETVSVKYSSRATATLNSNNEMVIGVGVGFNSTTVISGKSANYTHTVQTVTNAVTCDVSLNAAHLLSVPWIGTNIFTALEVSTGSDVSVTLSGTESYMLLSAEYRA